VTSQVSIPLVIKRDIDTGADEYIGELSLKYNELTDTVIPITQEVVPVGATTLKTLSSNTAIQTSSGKKIQAILLVRSNSGAALTFVIRASDTVDTADGNIIYTQSLGIAQSEAITLDILNIPDSKFLTMNVLTGSTDVRVAVAVESPA